MELCGVVWRGGEGRDTKESQMSPVRGIYGQKWNVRVTSCLAQTRCGWAISFPPWNVLRYLTPSPASAVLHAHTVCCLSGLGVVLCLRPAGDLLPW